MDVERVDSRRQPAQKPLRFPLENLGRRHFRPGEQINEGGIVQANGSLVGSESFSAQLMSHIGGYK